MMTVREAFALAFAHEREGRYPEARSLYEQILATIPEHPGALLKIGEAEHRRNRHDEARALFERALNAAAAKNLPTGDIWVALGRVHVASRDWANAQDAFAAARRQGIVSAETFRMLAWLALERGSAEQAKTLCREGLAAYADDVELLHVLGKAQRACGELTDAHATLRRAIAVSPDAAAVRVTLGAVCIDVGRGDEARVHLASAIEHGEDVATAWDNLGLAYLQMGELDQAVQAFERAVALDPRLTTALSNLSNTLRHACRWREAEVREREWLGALEDGHRDPRFNPFVALALDTTPAQQLAVARRWSHDVLPATTAPALLSRRGTRLRIGYMSSDFRQHPMSLLIARHFEYHDRKRFEVFGYSHGPIDDSAIRKRLMRAFDHWIEARTMSNTALAHRIRDDAIDVLIELNGHTQGERLAALATRPATVQVHYLGFPGTLGYEAMDGNIADAIAAPPEEDHYFSERVLRMSRCYFVTDGEREIQPPQSRAALGFADDDVVLVSFNQAYKLTRRFFDVWLDVLDQRPNAVLWLYVPAHAAQANIQAYAAERRIAAERVRFANKVSQDEHIARLACADLALDVLPYSSHTTACDALWAGVPMLSCRGTTFAGRVGESILNAVGLRELVAANLDDYRSQLQSLAADRDRLGEYKHYLHRERRRLPLFDTHGFTRDFEALVERTYEEVTSARR